MGKWVCSGCGYVHEGEQPPEQCPVCKQPASAVKKEDAVSPRSKYVAVLQEDRLNMKLISMRSVWLYMVTSHRLLM